jgi:phage tail P2-like protein
MAIIQLSALFAGGGHVVVPLRQTQHLSARFASTTSLQVYIRGPWYPKAHFAGVGGVKASAIQRMTVPTTFVGAGNATAVTRAIAHMAARLVGAGASMAVFGPELDARFGGAGNFTFDLSTPLQYISASFAGAGGVQTWLDWQGTDTINPGIDEIAGEELLYANASGLEKALADIDAYRLTVTYAELIRDQWDPYAISPRNLGYLAWAMGVNLWEDDWSLDFKRYWTANQWTFKYYRGSDLGMKMAVEAVGAEIVHLIRPPAIFYPGPALTADERAAYVARFPQLRLYPYAPRPQLPWLNYLHGTTYANGTEHRVKNGYYMGPILKFYPTNYNAGGLYLRTVTVYEPRTGIETPCTVRTVAPVLAGTQNILGQEGVVPAQEQVTIPQSITIDQVALPDVTKSPYFYPGAGNKQYLLPNGIPQSVSRKHAVVFGTTDATPSRVINIPRDGTLQITQFQATYQTIVPDLKPLNVRPEYVFQEHPIRKAEWYCGMPLRGMFNVKSNAWQYLYERWYLFDPTRVPDYRKASVYMGRARFGIKKYSAEAKIAAFFSWPRRYAYYGGFIGPGRFFAPKNTDMIDKVRRAVTASMAARDTVAINTRVKRVIQLKDVTKLDGTFKIGQWITDTY